MALSVQNSLACSCVFAQCAFQRRRKKAENNTISQKSWMYGNYWYHNVNISKRRLQKYPYIFLLFGCGMWQNKAPFFGLSNASNSEFIINTECQAPPSPKLITEVFAYSEDTFSHQNGRGVVFKKQETLGTPRSSTHALVSLCAGSLKLRITYIWMCA